MIAVMLITVAIFVMVSLIVISVIDWREARRKDKEKQ
jgi:hypothetical protein